MSKPLLFASAVALFGLTALFVLPALSALGVAAQDSAPASAPGQTNPVKPTAQSQVRAKEIYAIDCAVCHGDNGNGKTELAQEMQETLGDWTDPKTLAGRSDKELFGIIRNGKGKMPGEEEGRAKDSEVWNLVLYVRGLSKAQPAAQAAASN